MPRSNASGQRTAPVLPAGPWHREQRTPAGKPAALTPDWSENDLPLMRHFEQWSGQGVDKHVRSIGIFLVTLLWSINGFSALSMGLEFDGSGSYATAANSASLNVGSNDFTVAAWIKRIEPGSAYEVNLVGKNLAGSYGGHYPGFRLRHEPTGKLTFQVADSQTGSVVWGNAVVPAGEWHHVAAVRSGSDLFIYIDGELDAAAMGAIPAGYNLDNGSPLALGASVYWGSSRYYTGSLDDVTLHARALSPLDLFQQMSVGPDLNDPALLASYSFEAGATTDDTGHDHELTLHGSAQPGKGTRGSRHTVGAHFDGSSAVHFDNTHFNMGTNDFALSGWFRADAASTATDMTIAGLSLAGSYGGSYSGYRVWHRAGDRVAFAVRNGSQSVTVYSDNTFAGDTWHHFSAIRSGSDLLLYVDGRLDGAKYGVLPANYNVDNATDKFAIGASVYWTSGRHFHGDIDGISLHTRAFGEREVLEVMQFGPVLEDPTLRASISFDRSGFHDDSALQHQGTLLGNLTFVPGAQWTGYEEVDKLETRVPAFEVVRLPASGAVSLAATDALTFDSATGLGFSDASLVVEPHDPYNANDSNGLPIGTGPHVSPTLEPFRLEEFTAEFIYLGSHNAEMIEYAGIHGFRALQMRDDSHYAFMPAGTLKSSIRGHNFNSWFALMNPEPDPYEEDMWHLVPDTAEIADDLSGAFPYNNEDYLTLDLEGPAQPRSRESLEYGNGSTPPHIDFPHGGTQQEKESFFEAYYQGFVAAEVAAMAAARSEGHPNVGIYGLWPRTWFGLGDPLPQAAWDDFIKYIALESDVMYPSVYFFYRNVANVAYALANIERLVTLRAQLPQGTAPGIRPYFWNQYHGGGGGWRHWRGQPVRHEDLRAAAGMTFFTEVDGMVHWSWSAAEYHAQVLPVQAGESFTVKDGFSAASENGPSKAFERYDMIYVLEVTANDTVRFQALPAYGGTIPQVDADPEGQIFDDGQYQYPVYTRPLAELRDDLMTCAAPMAGEFEGLALVKLIESTLRHGVPELNLVESEAQVYSGGGPVVRQLRAGPLRLVVTYDPNFHTHTGPVPVVLEDFAGRAALDLTLEADEQLRVYILTL